MTKTFISVILGELSWLDRNRFSISFDVYTTPRQLREKEKNRRKTIIVGGSKLPWFAVESVSQINNNNININNGNGSGSNINNIDAEDEERNSHCIPGRKKNKNKAKCIPVLKINNSREKEKEKEEQKNSKIKFDDTHYENESIRICFNHIGVHYDCYEENGTLGETEIFFVLFSEFH